MENIFNQIFILFGMENVEDRKMLLGIVVVSMTILMVSVYIRDRKNSTPGAFVDRINEVISRKKAKAKDLRELMMPINDATYIKDRMRELFMSGGPKHVVGSVKEGPKYIVYVAYDKDYKQMIFEIGQDAHGKWFITNIQKARAVAAR